MTDLPTLRIEGRDMGAAYITGTTSALQDLISAVQKALSDGKAMAEFNHLHQIDDYTLVIRRDDSPY